MESKEQVREYCFNLRNSLGTAYIEQSSKIIIEKFLFSSFYHNAKTIFTYLNTPYEINTNLLIQKAFHDQKIVLAPVIIHKNEMVASFIYKDSCYIKNKYGINEPEERLEYHGEVDIIIVPGLAFDERGNRIGYGGGYYDRFLENCINTLKIGLCLNEFISNQLPTSKHDIKMDVIFTQDRIINLIN